MREGWSGRASTLAIPSENKGGRKLSRSVTGGPRQMRILHRIDRDSRGEVGDP